MELSAKKSQLKGHVTTALKKYKFSHHQLLFRAFDHASGVGRTNDGDILQQDISVVLTIDNAASTEVEKLVFVLRPA